MLIEWELPNNVPYIFVTDNGANIKLAIEKSLWEWENCFAHTLQLAIHDAEKATEGFGDLCKKARSIVTHYNHSTTALARLQRVQVKLGIAPLEMVQEVTTRWNSQHDMMARLLELKESLSADIASSDSIENLTLAQWKLLAGFVKILAPLKKATEELSSELYPTISMIVPVLHCLETTLVKFIQTNEDGCGKMFARALSKSIASRFPNYKMKNSYIMAMCIDPRFKAVVLNKEELMNAKLKLIAACQKFSAEKTESSVFTPEYEKPECENESDDFWQHFEILSQEVVILQEEHNAENAEVSSFLSEQKIPRKDNPLEWWKINKTKYPRLERVARYFLSIPATSVSSERLFSASGNIVSVRRECLTTTHVQELCFLHGNLKLN